MVDTKKEELGCLEFFFTPPNTSGKAWEDFLPLSKQKRGVARHYNDSWGVLEGAVTTPWVDLQGLVHEGLCVIHRAQRKLHPNRRGPSKENIENKLPSILTRFFNNTSRFQLELTSWKLWALIRNHTAPNQLKGCDFLFTLLDNN
jgi:hypothetical protein